MKKTIIKKFLILIVLVLSTKSLFGQNLPSLDKIKILLFQTPLKSYRFTCEESYLRGRLELDDLVENYKGKKKLDKALEVSVDKLKLSRMYFGEVGNSLAESNNEMVDINIRNWLKNFCYYAAVTDQLNINYYRIKPSLGEYPLGNPVEVLRDILKMKK